MRTSLMYRAGETGLLNDLRRPGGVEVSARTFVLQNVRDAMAASAPFPKRPGHPQEVAGLALKMCRIPFLSGEDVHRDGAIRMTPRRPEWLPISQMLEISLQPRRTEYGL